MVVGAGALLVAIGVALLLSNTVNLRSSAGSATRADAQLLQVVNVERMVVDAETGLRGYVITGRSLFLQPLYAAQSQLPGATAALQHAAAANHAYEQQSAALSAAARSYLSVYVPGVLGIAAHDLSAARSFNLTLEGKRQVDGIRARAGALEGVVSGSQASRQRAARDTANNSIVEAIVVLVLLTLLTVALGSFLGHLIVDRERARAQSEKIAQTLQESILPHAVPMIPGCELATRFIPGGEVVSGDFYDVLELEPGGWAVIIGDVSGKGASAAAATAMARWTLRSSLAKGATPDEALRFLNEVVVRQEVDRRFITAAALRLTLEPQYLHVAIACAGHPAPILVPSVGTPAAVDAQGDLLGMVRAMRLRSTELRLRVGDSLVAYTDGVTDQGPESRPSPEQVLADREQGADAEQLAGILEALAHQPPRRHPDDIAILALRFLGDAVEQPTAIPAAVVRA